MEIRREHDEDYNTVYDGQRLLQSGAAESAQGDYGPLYRLCLHSGVGIVLTGIFGSRGANYVSDLVSKLRNIGGKT